jgi:hypothetical protein
VLHSKFLFVHISFELSAVKTSRQACKGPGTVCGIHWVSKQRSMLANTFNSNQPRSLQNFWPTQKHTVKKRICIFGGYIHAAAVNTITVSKWNVATNVKYLKHSRSHVTYLQESPGCSNSERESWERTPHLTIRWGWSRCFALICWIPSLLRQDCCYLELSRHT